MLVLMVMKYVVCLMLVGCAGMVTSTDPGVGSSNDPGGGGLPTPSCSTSSCGECVGCAAWDFACFGWEGVANLDAPGHCVATPADGAVQAMVSGVGFTADQAVAIVDGGVAISARAGDAVLVVMVPAMVGDHDCSTDAFTAIAYFANVNGIPGTDYRSAAGTSCTVSLAAVGGVGERVEGSFSATLLDRHASAAPLQLANGTFSVVRVPMMQ